MELSNLIAVARGDEQAELLLKNVKLINVFTGEIYPTDIAIEGSRIVGVGEGYRAREVIDLAGRKYLCPGFLDAHVHVESSMVRPREFARAVVPHGVTTVVTDPHEIANVLGLDGIRFMLSDARHGPLSMYVNLPSCVPATHMETSGADLASRDLATLIDHPWVLGLAEMMNFPGVVFGDKGVGAKLQTFRGRVLDGHCPGLSGPQLNAYAAAGIGSDHECTGVEEAREKLRLGLRVFMREGTNARNLRALLPLVTRENERRVCFCTDDRQPSELLEEGSIDHLVRLAIAEGLDPVSAIRMGTLNTAEYFRLHDRGAIAPGRRADLIVFSELHNFRAEMVFRGGSLVAQNGHMHAWTWPTEEPGPGNTMNIDWAKVDFAVPIQGDRIRVIGVIPNQLLTENLVMAPRREEGHAVAAPEQDLLKMAVIERHRASGNLGRGFVRGVGLKRGAIAGTVAHDHHNLVIIGADDQSMMTAARAVADVGGGQVAAEGDRILAEVPLPIAGLMSDQPIEKVREQVQGLLSAVRNLGSALHDPLMAMSFLALEVIPSLKLTDLGLVDVDRFEVVPLFVEE